MIEIEKFQDCNDIYEASARERYFYELLNAKFMKNTPHICDICNCRYTYVNRAIHFNSIKHQTALNNND